MTRRIKFIESKFYSSNGNRMETTTESKIFKKKKGKKDGRAGGSTATTAHRTHRSDDPIETEWKCVTSCSRRSDKESSRPFFFLFSIFFIVQACRLLKFAAASLQQLQPNGWIIMKMIRYSHPLMVTALVLLTFIISKPFILKGVAAEFYVGEYQTFADYSSRNTVKESNPVFHQNSNNLNSGGG